MHFGTCGGCQINIPYPLAFDEKIQTFKDLFGFVPQHAFTSNPRGFRARGEFRIHRQDGKIFLSMNTFGKNQRTPISNCPNLLEHLQEIIQKLPKLLEQEELEHKLYAINILGSNLKQTILTLIYHKRLDTAWEIQARHLAQKLKISIIGRAKNQKILIGSPLIQSKALIHDKTLFYLHQEGSFSQPNPQINEKMLHFITQSIHSHHKQDLLELYCGSGNFTIALAQQFKKVFATEVVKSAITILKQNAKNNQITNLYSARLSGLETIEALSYSRDFFRLKDINLKAFNFSHIFVDPPRSGIGNKKILDFMMQFPYIIYVSCNPLSLKEDLKILLQTHAITQSAIFDQFPHTHHLESAMILKKISFISPDF